MLHNNLLAFFQKMMFGDDFLNRQKLIKVKIKSSVNISLNLQSFLYERYQISE